MSRTKLFRRTFLQVLLLSGGLLEALCSSGACQGIFDLADGRFGLFIEPKPSFNVVGEANDQVSQASLKKGLWLRVTIIGYRNTLNFLGDDNSLWFEADIWVNGQETDRIPIVAIDYDDWDADRTKLQDKVDNGEPFTWRARVHTKRIKRGTVEIRFFDKYNNAVTLAGSQQPFTAKIKIN